VRGCRDRALGCVERQVQVANPDQLYVRPARGRPIERGLQRTAARRLGSEGAAEADNFTRPAMMPPRGSPGGSAYGRTSRPKHQPEDQRRSRRYGIQGQLEPDEDTVSRRARAPVDARYQYAQTARTAAEVAHALFAPERESGAATGVAWCHESTCGRPSADDHGRRHGIT
jgi:hypothetical protein